MNNSELSSFLSPGWPVDSIESIRNKIDEIDERIIANLAKRSKLTEKIGRYKYKNDLSIYDEKREKEIIKTRRKFAEENGLDPNLVEKIYEPVLEYSKKFQVLNRQ